MTERRDLVTLSRDHASWRDLPSAERIELKAVEFAFCALEQSKLFARSMRGRGISQDDFLAGVTTLDVLTDRIDAMFGHSLTDKGREGLGRRVLGFIGEGPESHELALNGDTFYVKEAIKNWIQRDFGIDKNSSL